MPIDLQSPPAGNLLFLHVQKTAGSTLHNIIARQYPKRNTFNIYNTIHDLEKFERLSTGEKEKIRLVKGHFPFGLHEQLSGSSEYITILRDPVERTISHFYHAREDRTHWHYKTLNEKNYTLAEALEKGVMPNLDNNMVRMISGNNRAPYGECSEAMLEKAMHNLENHFSVIGLQTRFDEFIHQAAQRFGWKKTLCYRKARVGKTRPQQQALDVRTMELIRSFNRLDQKLFDTWKPLIEQRIADAGNKFQEEVNLFKQKNQRFNRYLGWLPGSMLG